MADASTLPSPTPDQRRVAAGQFDRASQVIATGNFDYGIPLLVTCCKLDPANLIYRKALRQAQKGKYKNNQRGSRFAAVTSAPAKLRLKKALLEHDYARVLEVGEEILGHNPWDVSTLLAMGQAFDACGQTEAAIWHAGEARMRAPEDVRANKQLARLYEKVGQFTRANTLWEWVRRNHPDDEEAQDKVKELAASEAIARGGYESTIKKSATATDETATDMPATQGTMPALADSRGRELAQLEAKVKEEPHNPRHYQQLAGWYRRREDWDKVREVLQNGLLASGNDFELGVELAEANIQPYRQNLVATETKLRAAPDDKQLQQIRVQLKSEINRWELDLYRQKAERYPTDMSHRLEVGIRLLQANQVEGAIQELQAARTDPRLLWKAMLYLGFCFKQRNNWRLAQRNFEEALKNLPAGEAPKRKELLYQLARGTAEAGDLSAAIEWGYELANEDFGYKHIGKLLDEWQAKLQGA